MNTTKILDSEINDLKIASLPSRPTAPTAFGGRGYTSSEMKAAFDKLSLFIIKRFNMLLDDISSEGEGSLAAEIPTGISSGHTLEKLFSDITSGELPLYFSMGDETLLEMKERLSHENDSVEKRLSFCLLHIDDRILDASYPSMRDMLSGEVTV
ncbi:MAG: hypothetical protein E7673_02095 [Ruminococcaceae bacterium]|nr:hypothetical protein [Oscillospiraceae bacterium]